MKIKTYIILMLIGLWIAPHVNAQPMNNANIDELKAKAKQFVQFLVKEDFTSAFKMFDKTMKSAIPQEKLKETWTSLLAQVGAFRKQLNIRMEITNPYKIVFITCEFEKATLDIKVVFESSSRIAGLWFVPSQAANEISFERYAKNDIE